MIAPFGVWLEPPSFLFVSVMASIFWWFPPLATIDLGALADANSLGYQSPGAVNAQELPRHELYSVQRPLVAVSGWACEAQCRNRRGLMQDQVDDAGETGNLPPRSRSGLGGKPKHE